MTLDALVQLSRTLAQPELEMVIIGEGNTSHRVDSHSFWVKASGYQLRTATAQDFVQVYFDPILGLFENPPDNLDAERDALLRARVDDSTPIRPSVETTFHGMLLHDCGVNCIAHTHPVVVNQLLCSEHAETFARRRLFPDEVVLCGPESVFVPYVDPGLPLAQAIRERTHAYMDKYGEAPKVILLANHGMIALGENTSDALNITLMCVKAAKILSGTYAVGTPQFLSDDIVRHIYFRPDEIYRRRLFVQDDAQQD